MWLQSMNMCRFCDCIVNIVFMNTRNISIKWLSALLLLALSCADTLSAAAPVSSTVELMGSKFTAYKVSKKESLYAISRRIGVNYDLLSQWNLGFTGEVPKGYTLYIPQDSKPVMPVMLPERTVTYKVKYGDTLYRIAHSYNSTVADIIALNPKLRSSVLTADTYIKIPENSAQRKLTPVIEQRQGIVAFRYHEVRRDESSEGIARTAGINEGLLSQTNPGVQIKKGARLAIPVIGTISYTTYKPAQDSREMTAQGQQAIFDSIAAGKKADVLNVAVILSNPSTNKDIDFSRGFLTAVKEFGEVRRHTDIRFVNGASEGSDLILDPAIRQAELIFTTYDSKVPEYLATYAEKSGKTLINAFAIRDSLFRTNPAIINLMSSPTDFNAQVSQYILEKFGRSYIVFIGDPLNAQDQIAFQVMNGMDSENFTVVENLTDVVPHPALPMVFYSLANNKKGMMADLEAIKTWMEANPAVEINTIGRPSWIVHADANGNLFRHTYVNLPTRFYFPDREEAPQQFIKRYQDFFHAEPVRSYPAYSVMGYDAAWNFLQPGSEHQYLQMPFRLTRVSGGGEYNSSAFMLRYYPGMPVELQDIIPYQIIDE